MTFRLHLSLLMIWLSTSCAEQASPDNSAQAPELQHYHELLRMLETPQYSEPGTIAGLASFGREMVQIGVCRNGEETCSMPINVDGSEQPCWLEFRPSAEADLKKIGIVGRIEDGSYWLKGQGRIATRPGLFGHLNSYTCQVELQRVTSLKPTRPWAAPPPP